MSLTQAASPHKRRRQPSPTPRPNPPSHVAHPPCRRRLRQPPPVNIWRGGRTPGRRARRACMDAPDWAEWRRLGGNSQVRSTLLGVTATAGADPSRLGTKFSRRSGCAAVWTGGVTLETVARGGALRRRVTATPSVGVVTAPVTKIDGGELGGLRRRRGSPRSAFAGRGEAPECGAVGRHTRFLWRVQARRTARPGSAAVRFFL